MKFIKDDECKNKLLRVESTKGDEVIATITDDKEIVVTMKVVDEF